MIHLYAFLHKIINAFLVHLCAEFKWVCNMLLGGHPKNSQNNVSKVYTAVLK